MKKLKGVWIPSEVLTDTQLNDKEKIIYSMILSLSNNRECTMSNAYIGKLLNICNVQVSRIINSLKKKGYIKTEMIYKENSKEIALRKSVPINKNVKEIINNNKIFYKNGWHYEGKRDYSDYDFSQLYANNFKKDLK